jgi:hypothetical protein
VELEVHQLTVIGTSIRGDLDQDAIIRHMPLSRMNCALSLLGLLPL